MLCPKFRTANADIQRSVDFFHFLSTNVSHISFQPGFVQCTELLQQYHGFIPLVIGVYMQAYVSGYVFFLWKSSDRCNDDGRTVTVTHIVLDYENWTNAALLAANYRR